MAPHFVAPLWILMEPKFMAKGALDVVADGILSTDSSSGSAEQLYSGRLQLARSNPPMSMNETLQQPQGSLILKPAPTSQRINVLRECYGDRPLWGSYAAKGRANLGNSVTMQSGGCDGDCCVICSHASRAGRELAAHWRPPDLTKLRGATKEAQRSADCGEAAISFWQMEGTRWQFDLKGFNTATKAWHRLTTSQEDLSDQTESRYCKPPQAVCNCYPVSLLCIATTHASSSGV